MSFIEDIYKAGVVGAGGAGFPTHIKYKANATHLMINAAECEPLLFTDQYNMENYADDIISAISLAKSEINADKATIGIKSKYIKSISALQNAIKKQNADVDICSFDSYYPAGDEQSIINEITGEALPAGKIPLDMKIIVSNVSTMKNIYDATKNIPVTEKCITVTGEVVCPSIITVPIGTSIKECINLSGGSSIEDYDVIIGGPMMGKLLLKENIDTTFVTKTTGGIIILPKDHKLITRRKQSIEHIKNQASSACIQCTFCTELCPRYLKGHPLKPHKIMKAFGFGDLRNENLKQASLCCECGICELYSCPMGLSPRMVNAHVKIELRKNNIPRENYITDEIHDMLIYRKIPTSRLISKIDIEKYYKIHDFNILKTDTDTVTIMLSQHIGKVPTPVVNVGDTVKKGDVIADLSIDDMGAIIHASIDGKVTEITNKDITIKKVI